jgi:hypothetical protein
MVDKKNTEKRSPKKWTKEYRREYMRNYMNARYGRTEKPSILKIPKTVKINSVFTIPFENENAIETLKEEIKAIADKYGIEIKYYKNGRPLKKEPTKEEMFLKKLQGNYSEKEIAELLNNTLSLVNQPIAV